jgi:hypothetical protein
MPRSACVDLCAVQCIYEFDPTNNLLFSEVEASSGVTENSHMPESDYNSADANKGHDHTFFIGLNGDVFAD